MDERGMSSVMAPADRMLCVLGGAMLIGRGLTLAFERRRLFGAALGLTGGALLLRGALATSAPMRRVRVV